MAFAKPQKLVNWAKVVFNNFHSRLWDLFTTIKLKKKTMGTKQNLVQPKLFIATLALGT